MASSAVAPPAVEPSAVSGAVAGHRVLNINIGIVGHVDSGKTSLARALSTHLSTSALDKAPQSQARGITLDLGFSAFYLPPPPHLASLYSLLQFTVVDCPGHASLIRTIIGGAQIIDVMLLVLDCTKGIQTQTAECLVLGEMLTDRLLVVANKADQLPSSAHRDKLEKGLRQTFKATKFGADVPLVYTSCPPSADADIAGLLDVLGRTAVTPRRAVDGPLYMAIDHAFLIKGQGTVLTGTILTGSVAVNSPVYLPALRLTRKVKSIQVFHTPVDRASAGDRAALCVAGLEAEKVERGVACDEGGVEWIDRLIVRAEKVRFYKEAVHTGQQLHVSIGHDTVVATCAFFTPPPSSGPSEAIAFDPALPYLSLAALPVGPALALLTFPHAVALPKHFAPSIIASQLNANYTGKSCRLAFRAYTTLATAGRADGAAVQGEDEGGQGGAGGQGRGGHREGHMEGGGRGRPVGRLQGGSGRRRDGAASKADSGKGVSSASGSTVRRRTKGRR